MLRLAFPEPTHEDHFLARYDQLVVAAATLTVGDRDAARELVHETYVQFVIARPPLEAIGQLDGYLFIMLRNLYVSRARRRTRVTQEPLAILDFDSAALGLRTLPVAACLQAADDLRWICQYALARRSQTRAASALLLHYFLEYRPSQIALLLHSPIGAVHKLLHVARVDARASLERAEASATSRGVGDSRVPDLQDLRLAIFRSPLGACVSRARLRLLYSSPEPIDVAILGHIVGCAPCLDRAHALAGLPPRADSGRTGGSGRSDGPSGARSRHLGGRLVDEHDVVESTREHRPKELRIVVNGLQMGMQRVAGAHNEQLIRLNTHDPIAFVEIFSDQDVRLLLLNAAPLAAGAAIQRARAALSEHRDLDVSLDLCDLTPMLRVTYRDPLFFSDGHLDDVGCAPMPADAGTSREQRPESFERWRLPWPPRLRLVIAGLILGVLLVNPGRTLAAVAHVGHVIVASVSRLLDLVIPRTVLPSRPIASLSHMVPLSQPPTNVPPDAPAARPGASSSADLELLATTVAALQLLDGAEALTAEQVGVSRRPDGRIQIDGIVDTTARRRELEAVLRVLPARRLRVRLLSADTATRRPHAGPTRTTGLLRAAEVTQARVPAAYEHVRRHLAARAGAMSPAAGGPADEHEAVRALSGAILTQSLQARVRGGTVRQLVVALSPADARDLPEASRALWLDLIRRHAAAFRQENERLRHQLEALFWPGESDERSATGLDVGDGDAWTIATRLFELASEHDIAVRHGFAVAADGRESLDVSTAAFRQSLLEAERLADALSKGMPDTSHH